MDPIRYGLLFERFLNPERVNPPDIDIDFADDRRADVIEYVREKYGRDSVAQIITFGTMGAKSVVRDDAAVARAELIPAAQQRLTERGLAGTEPDHEPKPAIIVRPEADGSYAVDVGRGVLIEPKGQDAWIVAPREPEGRMDLARLSDEDRRPRCRACTIRPRPVRAGRRR